MTDFRGFASIEVVPVGRDHPDVAVLREVMASEPVSPVAPPLHRGGGLGGDRAGVLPPVEDGADEPAVYVGVAYVDGRPAGQVSLRRHGAGLAVGGLYVAPRYRHAAVSASLLAAAELATGWAGGVPARPSHWVGAHARRAAVRSAPSGQRSGPVDPFGAADRVSSPSRAGRTDRTRAIDPPGGAESDGATDERAARGRGW